MLVKSLFLGAFLASVTLIPHCTAETFPDGVIDVASLNAIAEASVSSVSLARDLNIRAGEKGVLEGFSWNSDYHSRNWSLHLNGKIDGRELDVTMAGYVWGDNGVGLTVTYNGLGHMAEQPVFISGRADWPFDRATSDYQNIDFYQVMKVGSNSTWGWVVGSEIVVGGAIGAAGGVAVTIAATPATAGASIGALGIIAAFGATTGASSLISVSQAVRSTVEDEHSAPPALPERPALPEPGQSLEPTEGLVLIAVSPDGYIKANGPDKIVTLVGNFSVEKQQASGTIDAQ